MATESNAMSNTAIAYSEHTVSPRAQVGTIGLDSGQSYQVQCAQGTVRVSPASVLSVRPQVGDRVLLVGVEGGELQIAAILDRAGTPDVILETDHDLQLRLPSGSLAIQAAHDITLAAGRAVSLTTERWRLKARSAEVKIRNLVLVAESARAELKAMAARARTCDSVLGRWLFRAKRCQRWVAETDRLRAPEMNYTATETMNLRSECALLARADQGFTVHAGQIHCG